MLRQVTGHPHALAFGIHTLGVGIVIAALCFAGGIFRLIGTNRETTYRSDARTDSGTVAAACERAHHCT